MNHQFDIEDKKELIKSEILRVAKLIGKTPTQKEYKIQTDTAIKLDQINYLFGNWNNAILFSGLSTNPTDPPRNDIATKDLEAEFVRIANLLKAMPSKTIFRTHSKYSWTPYTRRFGSWQKTIDYYSQTCRDRFDFEIISHKENLNIQEVKRLNLELPLLNVPTNEFETIILFALLAKEMGITIVKVNAAFPDGLIIKDGKEIKVEFEYLSSNYLQHAHPIMTDVICICWRRDIDIAGLEIIAIEEYIRTKQRTANIGIANSGA